MTRPSPARGTSAAPLAQDGHGRDGQSTDNEGEGVDPGRPVRLRGNSPYPTSRLDRLGDIARRDRVARAPKTPLMASSPSSFNVRGLAGLRRPSGCLEHTSSLKSSGQASDRERIAPTSSSTGTGGDARGRAACPERATGRPEASSNQAMQHWRARRRPPGETGEVAETSGAELERTDRDVRLAPRGKGDDRPGDQDASQPPGKLRADAPWQTR